MIAPKVTAILLKRWISPIGGVALGRVSAHPAKQAGFESATNPKRKKRKNKGRHGIEPWPTESCICLLLILTQYNVLQACLLMSTV